MEEQKNIIGISPDEASTLIYKNKLITEQETLKHLLEHIKTKQPFSIIRLGDGENSILAYPENITPEHYNHVVTRALGEHEFTNTDYMDMRKQLEVAIQSADIIGTYPITNPQILLNSSIPLMLKRKCYNQQSLCRAWVNYQLYESNSFSELLHKTKIGIISCRNVCDQVEKKYNLKVAHFYPIAEEHLYKDKSSTTETIKTQQPHYPTRFQELIQDIEVDFRGQVYLVGAGHLGKYYCHVIKERGGIAFDIGSLFDSWAGIYTRTVHSEKSLDRRVLPKWML